MLYRLLLFKRSSYAYFFPFDDFFYLLLLLGTLLLIFSISVCPFFCRDNGTHFRNNLIDTWANAHGTEGVDHIPYQAPASGKIERYNGLLKTTLRAMGGGTFKRRDTRLAKAPRLVNTRGSAGRAGPAQSELLRTVEGDRVPVVHMKHTLGKTVWVTPASGKGQPSRGIAFAQGPGRAWWVMRKDGEVRCVPQGDLLLGEISQWVKFCDVDCSIILPLYVIVITLGVCYINGITVRIT